MSLIADALQPQFARGLLAVSGKSSITLDDLLGRRGAFVPSFDEHERCWDLDFRVMEDIASALAADCSRFACSAIQSFFNVPNDLRSGDALPWALVRAYYSAFYAGHALLRIFGATCSHFDGLRLDLLRKVLPLYGLADLPVVGLYGGSVRPNGTVLRLKRLGASAGGTHELFWAFFGNTLDELGRKVMLSGPLPALEAQAVFLKIKSLQNILCRRSLPHSWLSAIRNEIQYRHAWNTWFPARTGLHQREAMARLAKGWSKDPMSIELESPPGADIGLFVAAAACLVGLCRELVIRVGERSSSVKSFAHYGPLAYFAHHRV